MNRALFLQSSLAALAAPAASPTPGVDWFSRTAVPPAIDADPDRIVRITVCSRPFRAAGPRLDVETLGAKTIFHNYGHGGSGWSLSWGSADVVLEKVLGAIGASGEREIAVVGAGAIGLTTAVSAQRLGLRPTIYAKEQFPFVRSARATGQYTPDSRIALTASASADFPALWERMARRSFVMYQSLLGLPGTPVEWAPRYTFSKRTRAEMQAHNRSLDTHGFVNYDDRISDLYPASHDAVTPDGRPMLLAPMHARYGTGMIFNIADYSRTLTDEFVARGGVAIVREFASPQDVASLTERFIVNCTGYGARALWRDDSVIPVRGQIGWLPPQEGVRYALNLDDLFITARRDGIAVQPAPQGDDTGWNDPSEAPDQKAAEAGVRQLAAFYSAPMS